MRIFFFSRNVRLVDYYNWLADYKLKDLFTIQLVSLSILFISFIYIEGNTWKKKKKKVRKYTKVFFFIIFEKI